MSSLGKISRINSLQIQCPSFRQRKTDRCISPNANCQSVSQGYDVSEVKAIITVRNIWLINFPAVPLVSPKGLIYTLTNDNQKYSSYVVASLSRIICLRTVLCILYRIYMPSEYILNWRSFISNMHHTTWFGHIRCYYNYFFFQISSGFAFAFSLI